MKKLMILIVAAAMVGLVISRIRKPGGQSRGEGSSASTEMTGSRQPAPLSLEAPAGLESGTYRPRQAGEAGPSSATAGHLEHLGAASTAPTHTGSEVVAPADPKQPQAQQPVDASMFGRARALMEEGKRIEAREVLTGIYLEGGPRLRVAALELLNRINDDLVFNPRCVEGAELHVVRRGEVLVRIARQYGVNWRMIARLNGIARPELIRENQQLKILTGRREILVDKSDFRLALFVNGHFVKQYGVGLGKDDSTPTGTFVVDQMLIRPDWYPPAGGIIKYGEPGHLLGERWIGLQNQPGAAGLGIHGTDERDSIGTMCSNGCIRMLNEDAEQLYDFLTVGAAVRVVE